MSRITIKNLNSDVRLLNEVAGTPPKPYIKIDGKFKAQAGCYHLSRAYGGYALHQMNSNTSVHDVFYSGHIPARDLHNRIRAYIKGFDAAKNS